jgi:hypothetical protein
MSKGLFLMILLLIIGQFFGWIQVNGQFKWDWFRDNPFLVAIIFSIPVALSYMKAQSVGYDIFNGSIWSLRLVGFSVGIIAFGIYTWLFVQEIPNIKNVICLILAFLIILIQIGWK